MRLLLCLALILLFSASPAHAEVISGFIGLTLLLEGALAGTAVAAYAGAIGGAIVGIGISVAANLAAQAFAPRTAPNTSSAETSIETPTGVQSSLAIGAAVPRNAIFGPMATAGQLAYWNLYGDQNRFLQLVFTIGVGPHDSLQGIFVNGKRCSFGPFTGGGGPYKEYRPVAEFQRDGNTNMWVRFFNGFEDQIADQELVDFANPAGRWTTDFRGAGICYVSITLDYSNPDMFPQGIPQFLFEMNGLRLYDRRKDSTNGGVGLHRFNDQHTWEYTTNPALGLYLFERGLYVGSRKMLGRGLAPVDLLSDMFVAAANVCDETIVNKDDTTEHRYKIGMNVGADRDWSSVEHDFCTAFNGWLMESAGAYGPIAGHAQSPVASFNDDDLIVGRDVVYSQKRSRTDLVNTIFGTYTDPTQNWQQIPYPARASSIDVEVDGAEFAAQRDYPMIWSLPQVQRAGEVERRLARHQSTANVTLGFRFSNIEQGDWVTWTSARRDFVKTFLVNQINVEDDDTISLALREISADVFDFGDAEELDPLNPGDLAGINGLITSVPDFSIEALQIPGAGGLTVPALHAFWSPIHDQTVDEVYVEYRIVGSTDAKVSPTFTPANGEGIITDAVQAATLYEARANIITTPIRETFWTAWVAVTAPSGHTVPRSLEAVTAINVVTSTLNAMFHDFRVRVDANEQILANATAEAQAIELSLRDLAFNEMSIHREAVQQETGQAIANASTALTVSASTEAAFAQYKVTVDARFATNEANITTNATAIATANSTFASYQVTVNARFGTNEANITTNATAIAGVNNKLLATYQVTLDVNGYVSGFKLYNDGTIADTIWITDNFQIAAPGVSGPVPIFQVGNVNGTPAVGIRGNLYVDGSIITRNVAPNNITQPNFAGGTSNFTWNTSEQTLLSLPITSTSGKDIYVMATAGANIQNFGGTGNVTTPRQFSIKLNLYIDATLIAESWLPASIGAFTGTTGGVPAGQVDLISSAPVATIIAPAAANYTIHLKAVSLFNAGVGPAGISCTLQAVELKR